MNETNSSNSLISVRNPKEVSHRDVAVSTESCFRLNDGQVPQRSTEDYLGSLSASDDKFQLKDREPVFVLVDSSCMSSPSSKELLTEEKNIREPIPRKHYNKNVQPIGMPSTSRDFRNNIASSFKRSDSSDEMQMIDINLQSENEIPVDERELDDESIVVSYIRNRNAHVDLEGTILSTKKKSSLLNDVPKMETIVEGEQFTSSSNSSIEVKIHRVSKSSKSLSLSVSSLSSTTLERKEQLQKAINYLHSDNALLEAAELGDDERLLDLIKKTGTNIHQVDHLGRTALHLAVCYGNLRSTKLLLHAAICPNTKDNLGMTPLSLCLMRNPTLAVANLLFDHGAKILPRVGPMDTGLFMQFVAMCTPTSEDEKLLELLVSKGALVNDPNAPGGRQALHIAAMGNNCRLISQLIQVGAKTNARNVRGETPKDYALLFKCKEAYEMLNMFSDEPDDPTSETENSSENVCGYFQDISRSSDDSRHTRPGTLF